MRMGLSGPTGARPAGSLNRLAASATTHCLTGCAIGEVLGFVIATWRGWGNVATIAVAVALAYVFGYALTSARSCAAACRCGARPGSRSRRTRSRSR